MLFSPIVLVSQARSGFQHVPSARLPQTPERAASLAKIKQIAGATLMYAADHKNTLPPSVGFKGAIALYLRDPSAFTAPGDPKGSVGYFLDSRVSALPFSKIARPAETAMIVQGKNGRAVFPYAGVAVIAYVDGHARLADPTTVRMARTWPLR